MLQLKPRDWNPINECCCWTKFSLLFLMSILLFLSHSLSPFDSCSSLAFIVANNRFNFMLKFFPSNSTECRLSSNWIASKVHCLLFLPLSFSFLFLLFFWLICHFNICWSTFRLDFPHMNGILVMLIHRTTLNELNYCERTTHLAVLSSIRRLSWAYWGRFSVSTLFLVEIFVFFEKYFYFLFRAGSS